MAVTCQRVPALGSWRSSFREQAASRTGCWHSSHTVFVSRLQGNVHLSSNHELPRRVDVCIELALELHHAHPEHRVVADVDVILAHKVQSAVVADAEDRKAGRHAVHRRAGAYLHRPDVSRHVPVNYCSKPRRDTAARRVASCTAHWLGASRNCADVIPRRSHLPHNASAWGRHWRKARPCWSSPETMRPSAQQPWQRRPT